MREQNLEKLFRDTFSNFEADVNPNAWANISQQLQPPVPSPGTSPAAGNFGYWKYAALFLAVTSVVIVAVVYSPEKNSVTENNPGSSSEKIVSITLTPPPPIQETLISENPASVKEIPVEEKTQGTEQKGAEQYSAIENNADEVKKETQPVEKNHAEVSSTPSNANAQEVLPSVEKTTAPPIDIALENSTVVNNNPESENENGLLVEPEQNTAPYEQEARSDFALFIPNTFTPNGDDMNEQWKVFALQFKDFELIIFDQRGNEVFRSMDIENGWDGKLKGGSLAPAGVYTYVINIKDLNNVERTQRGLVTLLKK